MKLGSLLPQQRRIDNGEIGGLITVYSQCTFIVGIFTFLNTTILVYQSLLKYYMSIYTFIAGFFAILGLWMLIYYIYIFPSIVIFSNRQAFNTERNPLNREILEIKQEIIKLNEGIAKNKNKISITPPVTASGSQDVL